jgi:hypothetical protein
MKSILGPRQIQILLAIGDLEGESHKLRDIINKCYEHDKNTHTGSHVLYRTYYQSATRLVNRGFLSAIPKLKETKSKHRAGKNRDKPRRKYYEYKFTKVGEMAFLDLVHESKRVIRGEVKL